MPRVESAQAFINNIADRIKKQSYHTERQQTNSSVVLRKRLRNQVDSDRFGLFSNSGAWVDEFDMSSLYSLNIVQPTIRTNTSAMITAAVKIDIEPQFFKDAKSQMAAEVAKAIVDRWDRQQWTTALEEQIAQEQQIGPGVFIRLRHNPHLKRKHTLPQWEDIDVEMPGNALCTSCGHETPISGELEEQIACESCGGLAVPEAMPQNVTVPIPTGHAEFSTGDTETLIHPFFEFRVDDENTQGGDLSKARWFEHHYLSSLDELQLEYPESAEAIQGAKQDWSYSLSWQQALKRGRRVPETSSDAVVEQREVRDIYLTPSMYLNVVMEDDFCLKDGSGKVRFEVKKGRTFGDATFEGQKFEEPPVLCFRVIGTNLIDVYPCDFRQEFQYLTFLSNPSAFWGLFLSDLTILQDIINVVLTIQMYHIRRNAITSIVYNRSSFDPEAFEEDLIPTKEDLPYDIPISQQFGIVPALQLSGEPMQMLGTIMEMKSDVTLTTPALMGQAAPNEPYAAQLLQKQSALGLLAPAEISKASAKVNMARQQLKFAKLHWTDEDTEELLQLNSEWDEGYIDAFLECDIDKGLVIEYASGSEIPQSLIEREVKLNKALQDMLALAGVAPELVKPETINEVFKEMINAAGIDIDFGNGEVNERLAEARYDRLLTFIQDVQSPEQAAGIVQMPDFQPFPGENFEQVIEFYTDKALNELAQDEPNYLLVACLNALVDLEKQAAVGMAQEMTAQQLAAQQPMLDAQMEQEQMAQQQQAQLTAGEQEQAAAEQQMQAEQGQMDKAHERETQILNLMDKERDRELQREMAEKAVAK